MKRRDAPGKGDDELESDLENWRLDGAALARHADRDEEELFEIWPENADALELFIALQTQWRVAAGFGVAYLGLDYAGVEHAMRLRGVKRAERARLFEKIQAMESAALRELNRKNDG